VGQNLHLAQRLHAIQQALMSNRTGSVGLPAAVAGSERETFLREYLQTLFPAHRRFSTGAITDASGAISGQVDIAVEFGFIPSFPMPAGGQRLLLAESVALVIEVKSDLSKQWEDVARTTRQVRSLRRQLIPLMHFGGSFRGPIPVAAVGYEGHKTIEGLEERLFRTPPEERPDAALVIDSGCFLGFDLKADGVWGLYALCIGINTILTQLPFAAPNLLNYVKAPEA